MPITDEGERLTLLFRRTQARYAVAAQRWMRARVRSMDPTSRESILDFYRTGVEDIIGRRADIRTEAFDFYDALSKAEGDGTPALRVPEDDAALRERIRRSLDYKVEQENVVREAKANRGVDFNAIFEDRYSSTPQERDTGVDELLTRVLARKQAAAEKEKMANAISGVAQRHVLDGGRRGIESAVQGSSVAVGWLRVTAPDPCWFCAMLASRDNYKETSFQDSDPRFKAADDGAFSAIADAKVHNFCRCGLRPVYDYEVPEQTQKWRDLYREFTEGSRRPGKDFREKYVEYQKAQRA